MAIYLKKFKNVAEYNAYIASGGTKPKAYLTTDDNVVYYLDEAQGRTEEFAGYVKSIDLARVAFDGEYESLNNTPTIPTTTSELANNSGFLTQHQDISGKQNKLVSGRNIKTINNNSILGSGNIDIVSTVDSSLSSGSTNPVQNNVIYAAFAAKSDTGHTHDDRYYTETEIDEKLAGINTDRTVEIINSNTANYTAGYAVTTKSIELSANKFYIVGRMQGLTITLPEGADSDGKEYCCQFYVGHRQFTLTMPSTIVWQNGKTPVFEPQTCYQLVIVNNCATIGAFKPTTTS